MQRDAEVGDDDSKHDGERGDELHPEDLGIDTSQGPDLILGREMRRVDEASWRDGKARGSRANEPYIRYLVLEQLSDLKPAPVEWLWPGRIPLGRLTLLAGESRVGKSLVALDIAARVSRGAPWPDALGPDAPLPDTPGPDAPGQSESASTAPGFPVTAQPQHAGNVLILGMNSALAAADVVPRLGRAGADLTKIFFADGVYQPYSVAPEQGWKRSLSLADDLLSLAKTIRVLLPLKTEIGAYRIGNGRIRPGVYDRRGADCLGLAAFPADGRGRVGRRAVRWRTGGRRRMAADVTVAREHAGEASVCPGAGVRDFHGHVEAREIGTRRACGAARGSWQFALGVVAGVRSLHREQRSKPRAH